MPADMLKRTKTFFTSRSTVLLFIILLTASLTITNIIPQNGSRQPVGGMGLPGKETALSNLAEMLGLYHVFTAWWFIALSVLFVISLLFSTFDQFRISRARTFQVPQGDGEGGVAAGLSPELLHAVLRKAGYRRLAEGTGCARYVKSFLGYWGNFFLHFGMTLTVICSLVYVLTEHRVVVRAVSGARIALKEGEYAERRGLLARPLPLPVAVALVRLTPEFWEQDQLKALASELVFFDAEGKKEELNVALSDKTWYRGLVVYQQKSFGNAFMVEFSDGGGRREGLFTLPMPPQRDKAGYGSFPLDNGRYLVKAKYYANADRTQIMPANPQLVLRLYDGARLLAETSLLAGQSAQLGPYSAKLKETRWWADILFDGSRGTAGIFTGFALLLFGVVLVFFVVPREVVIRQSTIGSTVIWRATRFSDFYTDERSRILALCGGKEEK